MTLSNGSIFRVIGHLCGEFTGQRWIPRVKASGALMFSLISAWINNWINNTEAVDLRRYRAHYDVIVMFNNLYDVPHHYSHFRSHWLKCHEDKPDKIMWRRDNHSCFSGCYEIWLLWIHKAFRQWSVGGMLVRYHHMDTNLSKLGVILR